MSGNSQYTAQQFIDKIPGSGAIITVIANRVGCSWHTAKRYIDKHPTVKQAYDAEEESNLDLAEAKTLEAIKNGDTQMIRYYLSTKGKRRGYTERVEHTGESGGPVTLKVVRDMEGGSRIPNPPTDAARETSGNKG